MFPIHSYLDPRLSASQRKRAEALATSLRDAEPSLTVPPKLQPLIVEEIVHAPSLHLDDQSAITTTNTTQHSELVQDGARVRAVQEDYLITSAPPPAGYEPYCEDQLGLGNVAWLSVNASRNPRRLAAHAMQDRSVRHSLEHAVRRERLLLSVEWGILRSCADGLRCFWRSTRRATWHTVGRFSCARDGARVSGWSSP